MRPLTILLLATAVAACFVASLAPDGHVAIAARLGFVGMVVLALLAAIRSTVLQMAHPWDDDAVRSRALAGRPYRNVGRVVAPLAGPRVDRLQSGSATRPLPRAGRGSLR